jgi:hypothetical protein
VLHEKLAGFDCQKQDFFLSCIYHS